ncbi:hypothetical protein AAC387_Pa01g0860 [Persea americana]
MISVGLELGLQQNAEDSKLLIEENNGNKEPQSKFARGCPRCYAGLEEDEKEVETTRKKMEVLSRGMLERIKEYSFSVLSSGSNNSSNAEIQTLISRARDLIALSQNPDHRVSTFM